MKSWTQVKLKNQNIERICWIDSRFATLNKLLRDDDNIYWYVKEIYTTTNSNPEIQSRKAVGGLDSISKEYGSFHK